MTSEIGKGAAVIEAIGLLQLFKHAHEALRLKTGLCHDTVAHTVGLALHVTREVELPLNGHGLTTSNHGTGCLRIGAGRQCPQDHGSNHPGPLRALAPHHAGNMPLGDVAEFVRQHRGQFIFAIDDGNQPKMHAKIAPRQGKGIDAAITSKRHIPGKRGFQFGQELTTLAGTLQQALPDALHVLPQHRVIDVIRVTVERTRNAITQPAFGRHAHFGAIAQSRQLGVRRHGHATLNRYKK